MHFVTHPWINPGTIENRAYQENVVKNALTANTLCVLPTGMGKTSIAALVAAERMQNMKGKVLFLAPTRPLVNQHKNNFERMMKLGVEMHVITGEQKSEERFKLYKNGDIFFATPQTVRNDIKHGLLDLADFSLVVFDEAHRCIGQYSYVYIAKVYMNRAKEPLILALTASPGGHRYKINEVRDKLFIKNVEIKTREDEDVKPYVQTVNSEWVTVDMPIPFKSVHSYLSAIKNARIKKLISWRVINSPQTTKSQLLKLQETLAAKKTGSAYGAMSLIAEVIKVDHAMLLLETQCLYALQKYFEKLSGEETKASVRLMAEENMKNAVRLTGELLSEGKEHPKLEKLTELITEELKNKDARIIIFAQFRDTISRIAESLAEIKDAAPVEFIGQAKKKGKGLSQKEQIQILNEFQMGFYNILCASQVAEEGLDVVETNVVVFYEPTPSAVRKIQRSGRTARTKEGRVIVLMTKDTRDEAYHWSAHRKEKQMKKTLYDMQRGMNQKTMSEFKRG
ncbi:MAG: fanconi anemia group M protein [archaeon GW2011_AR5]|nr:MAG: fanconi anemia group M protein [archaeon GW2011_AR5]